MYVLDLAGGVTIHDRKGGPAKTLPPLSDRMESIAVGPRGDIYVAGSDATLQIFDLEGQRLVGFPVPAPHSIGVLSSGHVVVASPKGDKLLHLFTSEGRLLKSFGEVKSFDPDPGENEFLNRGKVVVGPSDEIYYVSTYAPAPYAAKFTSEGRPAGTFSIRGPAVDFQAEKQKAFLRERAAGIVGGFSVIMSATVDPLTGHLWVGMNGLSTMGTLYQYDGKGTKLREYALIFDSGAGKRNITHIRDFAVRGAVISVLSWEELYNFDLTRSLSFGEPSEGPGRWSYDVILAGRPQ
jgi:hypothetical protein